MCILFGFGDLRNKYKCAADAPLVSTSQLRILW